MSIDCSHADIWSEHGVGGATQVLVPQRRARGSVVLLSGRSGQPLLLVFLLAAPVAFFATDFAVLRVDRVAAFSAVASTAEAAGLPAGTGWGGNHTTFVALSFARNDEPRAAHFSLSVTFVHRVLTSILNDFLPSPWRLSP
jgi:hypothetical protein